MLGCCAARCNPLGRSSAEQGSAGSLQALIRWEGDRAARACLVLVWQICMTHLFGEVWLHASSLPAAGVVMATVQAGWGSASGSVRANSLQGGGDGSREQFITHLTCRCPQATHTACMTRHPHPSTLSKSSQYSLVPRVSLCSFSLLEITIRVCKNERQRFAVFKITAFLLQPRNSTPNPHPSSLISTLHPQSWHIGRVHHLLSAS